MTIKEVKQLLKQLRQAIIDANNMGQWHRVQYLKAKKLQIKKRILAAATRPENF